MVLAIVPRKLSMSRSCLLKTARAEGVISRSHPSAIQKKNVKVVSSLKIVGPSPLRTQLIQNRVLQNERFSGNFLEKIINTNHFDYMNPPSVKHGWKAVDLTFQKLKNINSFFHLGDTSGQDPSLILALCHKSLLRAIFYVYVHNY